MGKFQKGNPGGPGRVRGSRNKVTLAAQALLDGDSAALTRKAVELALGGDVPALKMCLERILPPLRERALNFEVPEVTSLEDVPPALSSVLAAVATGILTPSEGHVVSDLLSGFTRALGNAELERRITALEER